MERETYNALVDNIYDAALNPDLWRSAVSSIRTAFNSEAAGFFIETKNNQLVENHILGIDPDVMGIYGAHYAEKNPWFTVPGLMKPGRVLTDYSLEELYKDRKAFSSTDFYQGWCKTLDFRHLMGGNLIDMNGNMLNFSFFRSHHSGHYSDREILEYSSLCRHLVRAADVNFRLDNSNLQTALTETILDTLKIAVVALGVSGRMEYMNDYARNLIYSKNGLFDHRSRLKAVSDSCNRALLHCIDSAYAQEKSSTIKINRERKSPLTITILPSSGNKGFLGVTSRYVTLLITDPDDREIGNAEYLEHRWSLTPLEAEFGCNLLKGLSVNQVAEVMGLTKETARWYSKQVMSKLDVNSQSGLIIKLMQDISFLGKP
ncbi:helix-turn-helix transcriptional regulator [Neptunomonas japonica]|uniref:helix-turn-helix transcriptional regulator n=1 Tax=Neptunomonas japonica TaxID=417574 RepID=UPI00041041F4|nr:LuxR C-terminal-related transcriptional regulator [Neptunomonas japonica]